MSDLDETWQRIAAANAAAGVDFDLSVAERDQLEALADDLNRELLRFPVIHAWPTKNGSQLQFWCKYCKDHHYHGRHLGPSRIDAIMQWDAEDNWVPRADAVLPLQLWQRHLQQFAGCQHHDGRGFCTCPAGSGDGHRGPHCGNRTGDYYHRGYILYEVEPNDARAERKPGRNRS
jgi:hypothetical protein